MKSIMEEASSIIKAIENAWERAGKPASFSIKVFEEAERNFFGMTRKNAKIALFFSDNATKDERSSIAGIHNQAASAQKQPKQQQAPAAKREASRQSSPKETTAPANNTQAARPAVENEQKQQTRRGWSPEMVQAVTQWMNEFLPLMDARDKSFSVSVSGNNIKISFKTPLFEDADRECSVFRSCAHLIMSHLRNKFSSDLKNLKVILTSKQ